LKKIPGKKQKFCYFFLYFIKAAANWQLVILLFRKIAEVKISRKFAPSLDILVGKGTNLVAHATVLVAILSPAAGKPSTDHNPVVNPSCHMPRDHPSHQQFCMLWQTENH